MTLIPVPVFRSGGLLGIVCALFLAAGLAGCAGKPAQLIDIPTDKSQVEAALSKYSSAVFAMDWAGVAALFAVDGEVVNPGQAPVRGRAEIERFLSGFSGYRILVNATLPSSTIVQGDTAEQIGVYRQRVQTPDGKVLDVAGDFKAEWARVAAGPWLLRRMSTTPAP